MMAARPVSQVTVNVATELATSRTAVATPAIKLNMSGRASVARLEGVSGEYSSMAGLSHYPSSTDIGLEVGHDAHGIEACKMLYTLT